MVLTKNQIQVIFTTLFIFVCFAAFAQDTSKVESKVDRAVVFLKGAQIPRSVVCNLKQGVNLIDFTKLSSQAVEKASR